jgi:hypothetical protein
MRRYGMLMEVARNGENRWMLHYLKKEDAAIARDRIPAEYPGLIVV